MRELRKWAWTAVVAAAAAVPAAAQQGATTTGTTTGTGLSGLSGVGQGSTLGNQGGGQGGGQGNSSSSSSSSGTPLMTTQAAPKLTAPTGTTSSSLQKSNFLAGYYGNPYYQGLISAQTNAMPGGFGMVLMPVTASNTGGTRGTAGAGGRGGLGGQSSANQSGILIPLPVQINYSTRMMFPAPPVAAARMQTDLRVMLDGTPGIANPKGIQIITDADNNVVLRGTVADSDEARYVEGLVRVTPGVRGITNELTATSAAPSGK